MAWKDLARPLKLYITLLVIATFAAVAYYVQFRPPSTPPTWPLLIYILLAGVTARLNLKIPYTDVHFSMDTGFVFAILMIYGPLEAMLADGLSKILNTIPHVKRETWYKVPFNVASGLLSVFAAGVAYEMLLRPNPVSVDYVIPMVAMTLAYFLVNSWTVAIAISLSTRMNLAKLWVDNFLWTSLGFFAALSIAILLFVLDVTIGLLALLVSVPILALVYFTQHVYLRHEQDSKRHIEQLEAMHMSTIETLSLAIDAKDQITHGHVHRVTAFVTKLAECLGVSDVAEIKGLRFASLVHDIGKIGIPDMILAKPGRFTTDEMERMRMHPVIGAQIVKAVSFDFPIADVVLQHHERWDGTGYPQKRHGDAINRFARMLAICDVYDALRSDRPYRRAMCREKAINILREERGRAFDPEIADTFLTRLDDLEAAAAEEDRRLAEMTFLTPSSTDPMGLAVTQNPMELYGQINYTQQEVYLLYEVAQLVGLGLPAKDLGMKFVAGAAKLIPYNTAILFLADAQEQVLRPLFVESRDSGAFAEITLPYGRGVSGWVAQNGHPLRNVDPELELAGIDINDHKYHAILSVPLTFDGKTAGVISLYSDKRDFYQERHQDLLVKLAGMVAPGLVNAVKSEEMAAGREPPDELTGLDGVHAMKRYFETDLTGRPQADAYSLYLLDLRDLHAINQRYGHDTGNRLLQALADAITAVLRPEDRCFRYGGDEFAIIAHGADKPGAAVLAGRVRRAVSRLGVKIAGNVLSPSVSVGHASYPDDGITPDELWRVADGNLYKDRLQVSPTFAGTPEAAQG